MPKPYYVGHGTYGCVFKHAVSCDPKSTLPKNAVAKVFRNEYKADEEVHIQQVVVRKVDPRSRFTVKLLDFCDIPNDVYQQLHKCRNWSDAEKAKSSLAQLIYEYGGKEIRLVARYIDFKTLFMTFKPIFQGLVKIEKHNYVHLDIKPMNIVYNFDTQKMSLIDFGIATYMDDVYGERSIISFEYPYFPPEFQVVAAHDQEAVSPSARMSAYYKNWRYALRINKMSKNPPAILIGEQNKQVWRDLTNSKREINEFYAYLKGLDEDPNHTIRYKIESHAKNKIDVFMLGMSLLEVLAISVRHEKTMHSSPEFYKEVLTLIRDMTRFDPTLRLTPKQALARYNKIIKVDVVSKKK